MSDPHSIPQNPPDTNNWILSAELKDIGDAHDALVKLIDPALSVRTIAIMKEILWQGYLVESNRAVEKYGKPHA